MKLSLWPMPAIQHYTAVACLFCLHSCAHAEQGCDCLATRLVCEGDVTVLPQNIFCRRASTVGLPGRADRLGAGHDGLPVRHLHPVHYGLRAGGAREARPEVPGRPQSRQGALTAQPNPCLVQLAEPSRDEQGFANTSVKFQRHSCSWWAG